MGTRGFLAAPLETLEYWKLTIIDRKIGDRVSPRESVRCRCECGGIRVAEFRNVKYGNTKSCGCLLNPAIRKAANFPKVKRGR